MTSVRAKEMRSFVRGAVHLCVDSASAKRTKGPGFERMPAKRVTSGWGRGMAFAPLAGRVGDGGVVRWATAMPDDVVIQDQGLTKPGVVLLEKIADAVGGIGRPYQIVRVAKAEQEAARIRAESEIEIADLRSRAERRFVEEETRRQLNMETITLKALDHLDDDASPEDMEDDWIANFFDKSRIVADEEMQEAWARILAGEANAPGSFSRQTINILANLDKEDAENFRELCRNIWTIDNEDVLVVFPGEAIYDGMGLTPEVLADIESLGLINLATSGLTLENRRDRYNLAARYFVEEAHIKFPGIGDNMFNVDGGQVILTKAGRQLALICDKTPIEGLFEHVCSKWKNSRYLTLTAASKALP